METSTFTRFLFSLFSPPFPPLFLNLLSFPSQKGILFKFAVDVRLPTPPSTPATPSFSATFPGREKPKEQELWMYGGEQRSDEAAQCVAGNELRGKSKGKGSKKGR